MDFCNAYHKIRAQISLWLLAELTWDRDAVDWQRSVSIVFRPVIVNLDVGAYFLRGENGFITKCFLTDKIQFLG